MSRVDEDASWEELSGGVEEEEEDDARRRDNVPPNSGLLVPDFIIVDINNG